MNLRETQYISWKTERVEKGFRGSRLQQPEVTLIENIRESLALCNRLVNHSITPRPYCEKLMGGSYRVKVFVHSSGEFERLLQDVCQISPITNRLWTFMQNKNCFST